MKNYDVEHLRNVCFVGHGGAGKTSLTEALLFSSGVINRMGRISEGNTVSDYLPEEVKHKMSISTSIVPIECQDVKINILDTPGYSDFIAEVKSSLRVVESGVLVLCGVSGLEVQSEIIWEEMEKQDIPRIVFINKLDRENSSFNKVLDQLQTNFPETQLTPLQIPIGNETEFKGVIDIIEQKAYIFDENGNGNFKIQDIPETFINDVNMLRESLTEAAAEVDDEILMKYLEGEQLSVNELNKLVRIATEKNIIVPVLCGSAYKNIGMTNLLNFLAKNTPKPKISDKKSALVFKTLADPYVGKMSFFKVYGGEFTAESIIYNSNRRVDEKIGQPFYLRGKVQEPVNSILAGDIGIVAKFQVTGTGDTICGKEESIQLPGIEFPEPNLSVAITPNSKGDEDKLSSTLARLAEEDPSIIITKNSETNEMILKGLGEMHLEIIQEKLLRKFGVGVSMHVPRIPYRETIRKGVKVEGKHKKQSGGHGQYGHVWINIEPLSEGNFKFSEEIFGGAVPKQYFPAVEKGIREAMSNGVLAGYPVTDIKVTLYDGSYHSVDSSEMAFKLAAILAFRKGAELAKPVLLEPVVEVEVKVPEAYMGDVIGDLNSKRGRVAGMEADGKYQIVRAHVPLSEMMRYSVDLKSLTQGRGSFKMNFYQYEEVPAKLSESLISQIKTSQG